MDRVVMLAIGRETFPGTGGGGALHVLRWGSSGEGAPCVTSAGRRARPRGCQRRLGMRFAALPAGFLVDYK